jgi:hypothetical protein
MPFYLFRCKACGSWAIEWFFPPNLFPFFSVLRFSFRFFPATPSFSIADLISSAHVLLGLHSFFLLSKVHASRIRLFILSSPILFMCPKPALPSFFDSLQGWFFFFKFTLKVEFLILSSLVFSSIFLTNLMSVLCFLLFCFPVKCPCFWTICQDWGGHFLDYFDLFLFVLPFLRKSDFFYRIENFPRCSCAFLYFVIKSSILRSYRV